jgi:hypothetical protein
MAFLLLIQTCISLAQDEIVEDCFFNGHKIDIEKITHVQSFIDSLHELYPEDNAREKCFACLIKHFPESPEIHFYHGTYTNSTMYGDTAGIPSLRKCMELNYEKEFSYASIALAYKEFAEYNDTLSVDEKLYYLDLAEDIYWDLIRNYNYNVGCYFLIHEVQKQKAKLKISYDLDAINFDTLRIIARLKDCGEFGGHSEEIMIVKMPDFYFAQYHSDSIYCSYKSKKIEEFIKYNGAESIVDIEMLNKFIIDFDEYSNENYRYRSNGPDQIAIENNGVVSAKIIHSHKWNKYLVFRKELFGF